MTFFVAYIVTYPLHFYYTEKSSESNYSFSPQGSLDVGQLINGRPYWRMHSASSQKPKSLILADWTAASWSDETIQTLIAKLNQLMTNGFPIYIWQEGRVEPLTKHSLFCLSNQSIRHSMVPILPETLITLASEQHAKLTKDHTLILDDYALDNLIHNTDTGIRFLDVRSTITSLIEDDEGLTQILNPLWLSAPILKKAIPPLTKIILSEYSSEATVAINKLIEHFPSVEIIVQYRKLVLGIAQIEQILENEVLLVSERPFKLSDLQDIKDLSLPFAISLISRENYY